MNNINNMTLRGSGRSYRFNVSKPQKSEINFYKKVKKVDPIKVARNIALMSVIDDIETLRINCGLRGHNFNKAKVIILLKRIYNLSDYKLNRVISVYKNYCYKNKINIGRF